MPACKNLTDAELVILLQKSDREAFAEIYSRYAESLAGFAATKLFSLEDARDILHDMFVKLWENRDSINITSNLQSYLYAIVRYRIIDKIRKNITREEYAAISKALITNVQPGVEQQIAEKELKQKIDGALNELPPRVKEIYLLSREESLTNREIAKKLNLSEQTVKNQLSVALKHLRQSIGSFTAAMVFIWLQR